MLPKYILPLDDPMVAEEVTDPLKLKFPDVDVTAFIRPSDVFPATPIDSAPYVEVPKLKIVPPVELAVKYPRIVEVPAVL